MKLLVELDYGFALNTDLIAALLRNEKNPDETVVVMASGHTFITKAPLSKAVMALENGGQTTPPRGKPEAVGGTGLQAVSPFSEPMQSAPETNSGGDC